MEYLEPEPIHQIKIYEVEYEKNILCVDVHNDIVHHYIFDAKFWNTRQQHGNYCIVGSVSRLYDFGAVLEWIAGLTINDVPAEFMAHHNANADREQRMNIFGKSIIGKIFGDVDNEEGDDEQPE